MGVTKEGKKMYSKGSYANGTKHMKHTIFRPLITYLITFLLAAEGTAIVCAFLQRIYYKM